MNLYYGLNVVTPAAALAVSDDVLTRYLRLPSADAQVAELHSNAIEATEYIEDITSHVAMPTTYKMTLSRFPVLRGQPIGRLMIANGPIYLPRSPAISVDEITYVDVDGNTITLNPSTYQLRLATQPAIVAPARLQFWPLTDPWTIDVVNITFTAGYCDPNDVALADWDDADVIARCRGFVPAKYIRAVKFIAAYYWFNRESDAQGELPASYRNAVNALRIGWEDA